LILASASPRRKELLSHLGIPFEVREFNFSEELPGSGDPVEIAKHLARSKSNEVKTRLAKGDLVITADTVVWCDGHLMGKPGSREEATGMLRLLSGRTHMVVTGVCLLSDISSVTFSSETLVTFKSLSDEEIFYYVDNYKPYDKAGAYGIQEWIGYVGVERIEGSYFNVMGLPVQKLYSEIIEFIKNA
ncbi:MAG: septum formation protein Maf, partial [Bacteroidia bacterium]